MVQGDLQVKGFEARDYEDYPEISYRFSVWCARRAIKYRDILIDKHKFDLAHPQQVYEGCIYASSAMIHSVTLNYAKDVILVAFDTRKIAECLSLGYIETYKQNRFWHLALLFTGQLQKSEQHN